MALASGDPAKQCRARKARWSALLWGLTWSLSAPVSGSMAGTAAPLPFAGLYVTTPLLIAGRPAVSTEPYDLPAANGVFIRLVWSAVEPQPGRYDWGALDTLLDHAVARRKRVQVAIIAGAFTPAWIFASGVPGATFVVAPHGGRNGNCRTVVLPAPWSTDYQAAYGNLVAALAAHIRDRPGAYQALRIVKISGINEHSEETRMPASNGQAKPGAKCSESDAIAAWVKLGYRPSNVVRAWTAMAGALGRAFPDKLVALAILDANDFPPIDDAGRISPASAPSVKDQLIAAGLKMFPGRFAVQWDGLEATRASGIVVSAGAHGAVIGWQANEHAGFNGSDCTAPENPGAPCTAATYRALLRNGIEKGGRYIEIWSPDALKFPDVIAREGQSLR